MKAIQIANYVIKYCHEKGFTISNLKLQKLLYFIQSSFLTNDLGICFEDDIEAWDFGPVVPSVYHQYKGFGSGNIPITPSHVTRPPYASLIHQTVDDLADYSATDLVHITQNQDPWFDAYSPHQHRVITKQAIKDYFKGVKP